ncbi:MAG: adenylate/guanylate cyclase domain-containing protein [Phyllobacteriaceae bacterium]|nr:adenylate/guanylate cyclase domain-containing protein [Phyllobacteriaceae bacterium]
MAGQVDQNGNATQRQGHGYTRQLTTVLSVDVVGYAKMMGQSEENTLDQLVECRGVIEAACTRAGGRLFGVAGDSMMVEFGSPVDAILAALDFQERIASLELQGGSPNRMTFRAGVNTGDVIARDGALFGDEVNIAARLQEIAAPGGLVISATAYHHASGRVAAGIRRSGRTGAQAYFDARSCLRGQPCGKDAGSRTRRGTGDGCDAGRCRRAAIFDRRFGQRSRLSRRWSGRRYHRRFIGHALAAGDLEEFFVSVPRHGRRHGHGGAQPWRALYRFGVGAPP